MKLAAIIISSALLSGCAGMASEYYSGGGLVPQPGKYEVLCSLPKTAKWDRSYAIVNNSQACRDLGGTVQE